MKRIICALTMILVVAFGTISCYGESGNGDSNQSQSGVNSESGAIESESEFVSESESHLGSESSFESEKESEKESISESESDVESEKESESQTDSEESEKESISESESESEKESESESESKPQVKTYTITLDYGEYEKTYGPSGSYAKTITIDENGVISGLPEIKQNDEVWKWKYKSGNGYVTVENGDSFAKINKDVTFYIYNSAWSKFY